MDSEATKHMILHRATFNTYKVISLHNVRLGDDSVAEVIEMGSNIVGVEMRDIMNRVWTRNVLYMPK